MDEQAGDLSVQVCAASPDRQIIIPLRVGKGATIESAVRASGILTQLPEFDWGNSKLGVFGKLKAADTVLHDGDRVELYRPLLADPKDSRRQRAAKLAAKKA